MIAPVSSNTFSLSVMAGEDPLDARTIGSAAKAQAGPYTRYLDPGALKGKRFGVPAFVLAGAGIPFQGIVASASAAEIQKATDAAREPLLPAAT